MKKRILLAFVLIMAFAINSVGVSADENQGELLNEVVYSKRTYYDEELDAMVYEKITGTPIDLRNISGSAHLRKTDTYTWSAGTVMTYYVEGDFTWDDDADYISVSNARGNVYNVPSTVSISNRVLDIEYGQYFFIFNKYVDVEFSFTATNMIGISQDFSVSIRVSQEGSVS
ncbi:MAG: hypothetical protein IKS98_09895 [Lachnospiraceae bacterium]|nr:hypothetical protein [Lachnospiraceae bacterium]